MLDSTALPTGEEDDSTESNDSQSKEQQKATTTTTATATNNGSSSAHYLAPTFNKRILPPKPEVLGRGAAILDNLMERKRFGDEYQGLSEFAKKVRNINFSFQDDSINGVFEVDYDNPDDEYLEG